MQLLSFFPYSNHPCQIDPLRKYYIPVASENFYRFEYQMVMNKPAQTEDDINSLQVIAEVSKADFIQHLSAVTVYFFGNRSINYSYRVFPALVPVSLINPVFNVNAEAVHGSSGSAPSGFAGPILFTIIWNDNSPAWNLYTCVCMYALADDKCFTLSLEHRLLPMIS